MVQSEYTHAGQNDGNQYNRRGKSSRHRREKVVVDTTRPITAPQPSVHISDVEIQDTPKPAPKQYFRKRRKKLVKPVSAPPRRRERNEVLNAVSDANNPERRRLASAAPGKRPCRLDLESSDSEEEELPKVKVNPFLDIFNQDLDAMYGTCTARKAEDPLLHERASDPHQKILTDMLEKIKAAHERRLKAQRGEDTNADDEEENFADRDEDDEDYIKHKLKVKQKARKCWRLIRRKLEELRIERRGKSSTMGWLMVTNHVKVMSNDEKARHDLYERYGFTPDLKKGEFPAYNPMAIKQNIRRREPSRSSSSSSMSRSTTPARSLSRARDIQSRQSVHL